MNLTTSATNLQWVPDDCELILVPFKTFKLSIKYKYQFYINLLINLWTQPASLQAKVELCIWQSSHYLSSPS